MHLHFRQNLHPREESSLKVIQEAEGEPFWLRAPPTEVPEGTQRPFLSHNPVIP